MRGTALAAATGLSAAEAIAAYDLSGQAGEVARLAARTPDGRLRLILLGVGDGSPAELRRAGAALARQLQRGQQAVAALPSAATRADADAFTEGLLLGGYTFSMRDGGADPVSPRAVRLLVPDESGPGPAAVIAAAVALARDLTNTPSDVKTPGWLADQAAAAAGGPASACGSGTRGAGRRRIWGIVAVGAGSARPPRLIELNYGRTDADAHVVLAGKGVTFDSGGLSLKPNEGMRR